MQRVDAKARLAPTESRDDVSKLARFSARVSMLEMAFERLGTALFLLDDRARILDLNARAHVLLAAGSPLTTREGALSACDPVDAARLTALYVRLREGDAGKNLARPPASLLLPNPDDGVPLRVQMMPMEGGRELPLWCDSTQFSRGTLLVTAEPFGPSIRSLVRTYGFTPAEAAIALLLCQGKSAGDIATRRTTKPGTVHSQIKQIYAKAGVAGHPQLIAKLFVVNPPAQ